MERAIVVVALGMLLAIWVAPTLWSIPLGAGGALVIWAMGRWRV